MSENDKLHEYQKTLIRKGLEQMRKGKTIPHAEVLKRIWRKMGRLRE